MSSPIINVNEVQTTCKSGLFHRIALLYLKVLVILVVVLVAAGTLYEYIGRREDQRRFCKKVD